VNRFAKKGMLALALTPFLALTFFAGILSAFAVPNSSVLRNLEDRPDVLFARRANNGRVIDADTECIGATVGLDLTGAQESLVIRAVNAQSLYGCQPLGDFLTARRTKKFLTISAIGTAIR